MVSQLPSLSFKEGHYPNHVLHVTAVCDFQNVFRYCMFSFFRGDAARKRNRSVVDVNHYHFNNVCRFTGRHQYTEVVRGFAAHRYRDSVAAVGCGRGRSPARIRKYAIFPVLGRRNKQHALRAVKCWRTKSYAGPSGPDQENYGPFYESGPRPEITGRASMVLARTVHWREEIREWELD